MSEERDTLILEDESMEHRANQTAWRCPSCHADLSRDGLSEVTEGPNCWTVWRRHNGSWEFFDEDDQDDYQQRHLECRACATRLPESLAEVVWAEVEASW